MAVLLEDHFLFALGLSIAIQILFFVFAAIRKTDLFTDLAYGLTFIVASAATAVFVGSPATAKWIIIAMITMWGIRLAGYLFSRIVRTGKDARFDGIRENPVRFVIFWLFQGLSVWVILLPALAVIGKTSAAILEPIPLFSWTGVVIWGIGLTIETLADRQKFTFKKKNPGKWTDTGLWRYSRHPNYFGELLCWWGIFVFTLPFLLDSELITFVGPVWITTLLLFITGIPTIETRYDVKFQKYETYQEYKRRTSLLIPFPPQSA